LTQPPLRIDVPNDYDYGMHISHELAGVIVLAAIGVTALPLDGMIRRSIGELQPGTLD